MQSHSDSVSYPNYSHVDIRYLRERSKSWVINNQQHKVFGADTTLRFFPLRQYGSRHIPQNKDFLESYYRLQILAEQVAAINYCLVRQRSLLPIEQDTNGFLLISNLIKQDTRRVVLPIAVTSWLTIDEFRWHNSGIPGTQEVPEDLSYGLVMSYPEYVIPYACFVLNTHRQKQLSLIDQDSLQACEDIINQIVKAMLINS